MSSLFQRIVLYTKDVMILTGRSERTARRLIALIRKQFNKKHYDFITVEEFCSFTGLNKDNVQSSIK